MAHKVFMYHSDIPEGEIVNSDTVHQLEKEGWVDTPAKLLPKEENLHVEHLQPVKKVDEIENALPEKRKPGRPKKER